MGPIGVWFLVAWVGGRSWWVHGDRGVVYADRESCEEAREEYEGGNPGVILGCDERIGGVPAARSPENGGQNVVVIPSIIH